MKKTFCSVVVILMATTWNAKADQTEVELRPDNIAPDSAFFDALVEQVRRETPVNNFSLDRLTVGRVDLNGDGRDELIVGFVGIFFCGNAPECDVSIYHEGGAGWRYVGKIAAWSHSVIYPQSQTVNSWRALKNGRGMRCWTTPEEIAKLDPQLVELRLALTENEIGQRIDPDFGGYLGFPGDPCWE